MQIVPSSTYFDSCKIPFIANYLIQLQTRTHYAYATLSNFSNIITCIDGTVCQFQVRQTTAFPLHLTVKIHTSKTFRSHFSIHKYLLNSSTAHGRKCSV